MNINHILLVIIIGAIPLLFAITIHEVAHGWVASKLGDKTALMMGRLTLNPLKHIDPIGTIVVPVSMLIITSSLSGSPFIFGWARPVPVNFNNLKKPRRDMAFVAAAGPLTNLLMAIIWAAIAKLSAFLPAFASPFLQSMSMFGIQINCVLMILNLFPIPPLDGSRVVSSLLPIKLSLAYDRLEPFGFWILIFLLFSGLLSPLLGPPIIGLITLLSNLFGLT